ncbi:hypothetical protein [Nocardia jinanensis]|uniref:Uncharacterized protein n=1 Tax=Nocardia jinanensis TaxID=382504 RepID=A0A917VPJ2_9NOCA|nr:hypothetical protein [Nocardia jinanensis]GGL05128.1 hypothetical protein GCM10011588_19580 [Nocardia jinanensis]
MADGEIHYFLAGGFGRRPGSSEDNEDTKITAWVTETFTSLDINGITLYDLTTPK